MTSTKDRIIWIFREPRSGSTTAATVITKSLGRKYQFVSSSPEDYVKVPMFYQQEKDVEVVFNTHFFPALHSMKNYNNPILIRISRRSVVEQCLSFLACEQMNWKFFNLIDSDVISDNRYIFEEFVGKKIEAKKERVDFFARHTIKQNMYWESVSPDYEHQVIYYEDMGDPIDIPVLGLYNLNLLTETIKLPDYKKDVFTNYDSVKEWLSVYKI